MKKEYIKINESGKVVLLNLELPFNERAFDKQIFDKNEEVPENFICVPIIGSLYHPKWTGTEWVESLTQAEIDVLNNVPQEQTETEMLMLAIAELDAQREIDKTETEMAIAELAEALMGGI